MIDTSFYSFLDAGTSWQVQEGKIDFDKSEPFVWFRRASTVQERLLSGATLDCFTTYFDVELVGPDIDAVQAEADTLRTAMQGVVQETMIATYVQVVLVEDHSDDYIPRSVLNTDEGLHLAAFNVKIIHRA